MDNMKKQKQHRFTDKHPVASALLLVFGGYILFAVTDYVFSLIWGKLTEIYVQPLTKLCTVGTFLLVLLAYKKYFKQEYEGGMTGGDIRNGFKLILIQCCYTVLVQLTGLFENKVFHAPGLTITCAALEAGVVEECIFRGLGLTTLMRRWKKKENRLVAAAFIISAAFSVSHLLNLLAGASLVLTVVQLVCTLCSGIFFAAVYMRTGNLIPLMAGHFFHDIMQYVISEPDSAESLLLTGDLTWSGWVDLSMTIILGCIGLWLLRKEKRPEIMEVWDKKWKISTEA